MKKIVLSALIVLILIIPKLSHAKKFIVKKENEPKIIQKKVHPAEMKLSGTRDLREINTRNFNNLLVLLIEFQEDSLTATTGNGKFLQDTAGYTFPIGSPPHDQTYFTLQLEALTYYYKAVSYGEFEVEVDIFPQAVPGEEFSGYTLSHEMSYYNPVNAGSELQIERFEEYFLDCFNTADQDENIDFSQYEHFMFIHAGSDWQHDVFGDSPSDLPSFYIVVGDGKEAIVDNGSVIINQACNVPETIIQDVTTDESGDIPIVNNWGVINGVMVHEFGHSIGFVDLYNTLNNTPQVGYYDIMDSGGSSAINLGVDETGNNIADIYYTIEGIIPGLPGAWSRVAAFEDSYRSRGILKDIDEFNFNSKIKLLPAEKMFDAETITDSSAYFVKVPLSETEYLLLENRQVDPDGDGGAYPLTSADQRVVLYPTYPYPNPSIEPTYEYDYLLPGWISEDYFSYGGGLLIWHIDEKLLYENNNYQNNTVNTKHSFRAVKIVEADGLDDIGNFSSMFWRGTAFEPFYKYYPLFDAEGWFTGWDDDYILNNNGELEFIGTIFNDRLSSTTKPALQTNTGYPSLFSIYDISSTSIEYGIERVMSFKFGTELFDETQKIAEYDSIRAIGNIGFLNGCSTFPIVTEAGIDLISQVGNIWLDTLDVDLEYDQTPTQQILAFDRDDDGEDEFYFTNQTELAIISDIINEFEDFNSVISDAPMFLEEHELLAVPTLERLYLNDSELEIEAAQLAYDGSSLIALAQDKVYFIDPAAENIAKTISLPGLSYSDHYPVCYEDSDPGYNSVFVQNLSGDVYRIRENQVEEIFKLSPYTAEEPSQLALGNLLEDGQIYLTFGAGNRVFAIDLDGTLAPGFPAYLDDKTILPASAPRIITFDQQPSILFENINKGYIAISNEAEVDMEHSFFWRKVDLLDQFYWDENSQQLHFIYADNSSNLYTSHLENIQENPIIWNGYRNNDNNYYYGTIQYQPGMNEGLTAFCFPNPVSQGEVRIKVTDAKAEINFKIFDIAGNIVRQNSIERSANNSQDIRIDTSNMASGVYFGIVSSENESKKISFAIIN
ncbi:MAG: T9SS type A sorting domain-containing protein [Candidatus Cloacimonetes bacterium]|nr:T9SS type A sorting domain-containing protein [Candidatus Cloacimonadota bacterium]